MSTAAFIVLESSLLIGYAALEYFNFRRALSKIDGDTGDTGDTGAGDLIDLLLINRQLIA